MKNPFAVLRATPHDSRQRIIELADEHSLVIDADNCAEARSILTHPRKRLATEVAWLPGVRPELAAEILKFTAKNPENVSSPPIFSLLREHGAPDGTNRPEVTPIALANCLCSVVSHLPHLTDGAQDMIFELARLFEDVDAKSLMDAINEDRAVSGFPKVTDITAVEAEIQEQRRYYAEVIKTIFNGMPSGYLAERLTGLIELAADGGKTFCPYVISDVVDIYETTAQPFFEKETENIKNLIQAIGEGLKAKRSDSAVKEKIDRLVQVIQNWAKVAKPLVVRAKSMGSEYNEASIVLRLGRSLSLLINNEHDKAEFSLSLIRALKETFSDMEESVEVLDKDVQVLENILKEKKKTIFAAKVGFFFKQTISISGEGINWKNRLWDFNSITRVRWGGTQKFVNGVYRETAYTIFWGNDTDVVSIELKKERTYSELIGNAFVPHLTGEILYNNLICRLWDTVGVHLLKQYLQGLSSGKSYRFASALVSDFGIEMERRRFFFSTERVFCGWEDMVLFNGNGTFCVGCKNDKTLSASFSYLQDDNIHVLESMLQALWKRGGYRRKLSSLLTV